MFISELVFYFHVRFLLGELPDFPGESVLSGFCWVNYRTFPGKVRRVHIEMADANFKVSLKWKKLA